MNDADECPICLERMELQDQNGNPWMICPNGCPTEFEIPRKTAGAESGPLLAQAANGAS